MATQHARWALTSLATSGVVAVAIALAQSPASSPAMKSAGQPADPASILPDRAAGIVGSKHDFTDGGRIPKDLCLPCHTPHISASQAPLLLSESATSRPTRSFATPAGELDAASLVCLSCHDGTVARDVYAGAHAMNWSDRSAAGAPPRASRLTNHPVGIRYPDGRADYASSAAVTSDGRIKLPGGRIQCTTCHDPHNTRRIPGMLVIPNDRSRLCLACHRL